MVKHRVAWGEHIPFGNFQFAFVPSERAWRDVVKLRCDHDMAYPRPSSAGHTAAFDAMPIEGVTSRVALVTLADHVDLEPGAHIVGLLIHESAHVWQELLDHIGEERPSAEFEGYMLQHIGQELIEGYCLTRRPLFIKGEK